MRTEYYYIVGRLLNPNTIKKHNTWEVQGVYDDQAMADKACLEFDWFVMPVERNTPLPLESIERGYYPY